MKSENRGLLIAIVILVALIFILLGSIPVVMKVSCDRIAQFNSQLEFKYDFMLGCMVKYNGIWMRADNLRGIVQ